MALFSTTKHLLGMAMVLTAVASSSAATSPGEAFVKASIATDVTHFAPGKPFLAAITLTLEPEWHVYWINPGDSGLPTQITWSLPDGWSSQALAMPVPKTFTQPGDIAGYGYENSVTFLASITPPLTATGPAPLTATVSYLVCKDVCLPGKQTLSLTLQAAADSTPVASPAGSAIATQAKLSLPASKPLSPQSTVDVTPTGFNIAARITNTQDASLPTSGSWQLLPFPDDSLEWQQLSATPDTAGIAISAKARSLSQASHEPRFLLINTSPAGVRAGWEIVFPPVHPTQSKSPGGR